MFSTSTRRQRNPSSTSNRNYDVSIPIDETDDDQLLSLLIKQANLSIIQTFKPTSHPKVRRRKKPGLKILRILFFLQANEKIYAFDKCNDERQNCKVGFLYQRVNQSEEADIFNNDDYPSEMGDFLHLLADPVRLKGFERYRGDLDVKNDFHGEYSYYTQYQNHEIMFNIAPMIPSTNTDGQYVKRKGLVANSFVCIVFQEENAVFIPDFISGKVTQIYITVQPVIWDGVIHYKVNSQDLIEHRRLIYSRLVFGIEMI